MNTFIKPFTIVLCLILFSMVALAQTPQGINYQAIARDASGNALTSQKVSLRFTILTGNTINYQETTSLTTNSFGLIAYVIGSGTVASGTFASIPWTVGSKTLKVEMDPTGVATASTVTYPISTSQALESVPYALAAGQASTASAVQITTGAAAGAALTSDASGNASWRQNVGFSVYPSSANAQTIGGAIVFDGTNFDDGNNVSSTGAFTAPVAGVYSFTATIMGSNFSVGSEFRVYLQVNGTAVNSAYVIPTITTTPPYYSCTLTSVQKLNASDVVTVTTITTSTTTPNMYVADDRGIYTYFMGYRIY